MKLNGVDQAVLLPSSNETYPITDFVTGNCGWMGRMDIWRYTNGTLGWYSTDGSLSSDNSFKQYINSMIAIVATSTNDVKIYADGTLLKELNNVRFRGLNRFGKPVSGYVGGVANNIISINKALEPHKIMYQYTNTEKFLYNELVDNSDGTKTSVLKSEILTDEELNNVVSYLPMCETDGYVRNMAGYSEGVVFDNVFDGNYYIKQSGNTYTAKEIYGNTKLGQNETFTVGEVVKVKFTVTNVNTKGWRILQIGLSTPIGNPTFTTSETIEYVAVVTKTSAHSEVRPDVVDGTGSIDITNVSIQRLASTYEIENYTNACRDEAKQLQSGLQTCFLKRDVLGVPTGSSFNELECDGSGYVTTGWVPPIDKSWTLSFVIDLQPTKKADCWSGSEGNSSTEYVLWGTRGHGTQIYLRISDARTALSRTYGKTICTISFDANASNGVCAWNAFKAIDKSVVFDTPVPPICIGERQRSTYIANTNLFENGISNFRVFSKVVEPDEIIGDLVFHKDLFPDAEVIAHQAFPSERPSETLAAYKNVVEHGYNILDIDITFTKDNIPVCCHNVDLSTFTNGIGNIPDLTYAEVKGFYVNTPISGEYTNEPIPKFEDIVKYAKQTGKKLVIETKNLFGDEFLQLEIIYNILSKHNMIDNVVDINSFELTRLQYMRTLMPDTYMYLVNADPVNSPIVPDDILAIGGKVGVIVPAGFVDDAANEDEILGWQNMGIRVGLWSAYTINKAIDYFNRGITHIFVTSPIFETKKL
jgi:glycerophosphoryl diester phosphodiesterase